MHRLVPTLALAGLLVAACTSGPVGIDACKSIETARCQQLVSCPQLSMQPPVWTSGDGVGACIRYYDTACLHGLATGTDPGTASVNQCVTAIKNNGCDVVATPEIDPACAWLMPAVPEAGPVEDATSEVETE